MNEARMMNILLSPRISEKSSRVGEKHGQIVFNVIKDANKCEIKEAVEKLFNVKVKKVNVLNSKPLTKYFGRREGIRQGYKKAYVTLQAGYDINFTGA